MTERKDELYSMFAACIEEGGLIAALKKLQQLQGIGEEEINLVAEITGLSVQQLESVLSFYTAFNGEKPEPCADATVYDPSQTGETRYILHRFDSLDAYRDAGGYSALEELVSCPATVIDVLNYAKVTGRSGSSFPVSAKWRLVRNTVSDTKYVVMNGAEGEPGTGKDRALLLANPYAVIEGMTACGLAVGAKKGYIYVRDGYEDAFAALDRAVAETRAAGLLGANLLGSGYSFELELLIGAGCYVCGEETALLEYIEGRRGEPTAKPPYPGTEGLWGCPTVINNAETFANVPIVLSMGAETYKEVGTESCPGTKLFTVSGCVQRPGVYEFPYGITLRQLLNVAGGCTDPDGLKGVLIGGNASGSVMSTNVLDVPLDIYNCSQAGMSLGTGAVRFIGGGESVVDVLIEAYTFFADESCGKCVPCRLGISKLLRVLKGEEKLPNAAALTQELNYIQTNALCGLGQASGTPVLSAIRNFPDEIRALFE